MPTTDRTGLGVLLICACYFMYSLHYATVKWLDVGYPYWQLIFIRSILMLLITVALRPKVVAEAARSPYKGATAVRALLQLGSSWCFFAAAARMGLGEVATLYATAPLIIVMLSPLLLGETVGGWRWVAVAAGLAGTAIAASPTGDVNAEAVLYGLGSGAFWALTAIFTRKSGARESTPVQLFTTAVVFCAVSAAFADWRMPQSAFDGALMLALGVQIYLGQRLFFEGYRYAPASLLGPLEYTSVLWSGLLGFVIFRDVPTVATVTGAALIIASGIALAAGERRAPGRAQA